MEQASKPTGAPQPKNKTMLYAIIIIVLVVVGVGVYYLTRPPGGGGTSGPQVSIQDDNTCTQNDAACLFNPATISATANGTSVTWTIVGGAPHTVHSCVQSNLTTDGTTQAAACPKGLNSNPDPFASSTLRSGGTTSYPHQFTHIATYYYYCSIHTWMHGNVTVAS